ncbi:MAG: hypothetical protein Phyf2KO_22230 [Phycisphaerales bacterium]
MLFNPFTRKSIVDRGRLARRTHEVWLTNALSTGKPHPRIPKREARKGGFDQIMRTPGGRIWARQWWAEAFSSKKYD